ncbi:MAG: hypothetical protein ACLFUB_19220 [Cyclobacteriaceae bacterium]
MKDRNIQLIVEQLKADLDQTSKATYGLKNGERFRSVERLTNIRQIIVSIEDIENALEQLMEEQSRKKTHTE